MAGVPAAEATAEQKKTASVFLAVLSARSHIQPTDDTGSIGQPGGELKGFFAAARPGRDRRARLQGRNTRLTNQ